MNKGNKRNTKLLRNRVVLDTILLPLEIAHSTLSFVKKTVGHSTLDFANKSKTSEFKTLLEESVSEESLLRIVDTTKHLYKELIISKVVLSNIEEGKTFLENSTDKHINLLKDVDIMRTAQINVCNLVDMDSGYNLSGIFHNYSNYVTLVRKIHNETNYLDVLAKEHRESHLINNKSYLIFENIPSISSSIKSTIEVLMEAWFYKLNEYEPSGFWWPYFYSDIKQHVSEIIEPRFDFVKSLLNHLTLDGECLDLNLIESRIIDLVKEYYFKTKLPGFASFSSILELKKQLNDEPYSIVQKRN